MKNNQFYSYFIFFFIVGFFMIGVFAMFGNKVNDVNNTSSVILAQNNAEYVPLAEIEGFNDSGDTPELGPLLQLIFNWGIAIAVVLSIVMIILGGIQYMTIDSISGKSDGIRKIQGALAGLILAVSSWLILRTINPQLINLDITNTTVEDLNTGGTQ
jgi:hypothetical protein